MKIARHILAVLLAAPFATHACTFPEPRSFTDSVRSADSIFVLRILDERVTDRIGHHRPVIEGRVEIVETILGEPADFERIEFFNGPCGGVRLDVNHHYVVFTSQSGGVLRLAPADNSIVSVEEQYLAGFDSQNYKYPFLRSVRAFVNKEISAEAIDPFPNIERNGTVRRIDCDPCHLRTK